MFTFPLIALFVTALFFAAIPVVLFALMLETCANRAAKVAPATANLATSTIRLRAAA
jgi:hypothetical protein